MAKRVNYFLAHRPFQAAEQGLPKGIHPSEPSRSLCTGQHPNAATTNPHSTSSLARASEPLPPRTAAVCVPPLRTLAHGM